MKTTRMFKALLGLILAIPSQIDAAAPFAEFIDPNPNSGNQFGATVVPLSTGNVVITSPFDDAGGTNAGAVYLFNGATGVLISTLRGSAANDNVGNSGVTALNNGNYIVISANWDNGAVANAGAVTWGSGINGINGIVSASNSLVGTTASDQVGSDGVTALSNGNYLVRSKLWDNGAVAGAGAVTWGNGSTGISGAVSSSNSLVGTTANQWVGEGGIYGVIALSNGNYVVRDQKWDNGAVLDAGAVTWGNGSTGVTGSANSSNSLVGTQAGDSVSSYVGALNNGNYVVYCPYWDNGAIVDAGAVTWCNGTSGLVGAISSGNSLVGDSADDQVGLSVTALKNGNYVVQSPDWNSTTQSDVGAVTWANGNSGLIGVVSSSNSLVGNYSFDRVGNQGVTELSNGNYVVHSPDWRNGPSTTAASAGAVTWGNGSSGAFGPVNGGNSLIGTKLDDRVGGSGVVALSNGNYVVTCPFWDNGTVVNAGAVVWGNGSVGSVGPVSSSNSLVGTSASDRVGNLGVIFLSNGNYVVSSSLWDNGGVADAGAVTWGNGSSGAVGPVSGGNSLVGATASDQIGGVTALTNGNYIVRSSFWDNASMADTGAVTWCDGSNGLIGVVGTSNSLVGSSANDQVGSSGVTALSNGNYVVGSRFWNNGAVADAGAVTWANGTSGLVGVVSSSNSLIGVTASDQVGSGGVTPLSNGNYLIRSAIWDNGAVVDAGAVTWGGGNGGVSGPVTSGNSIVGLTGSTALQTLVVDQANNTFMGRFRDEGSGKVRLGSLLDGLQTAPVVNTVSPSTGSVAGGTVITITGSNFTGLNAVSIGGVPALSFTVVDASTITASTPAGVLGPVDVVVATPSGIATGVGLFTYVTAVPPEIAIEQAGSDVPTGSTHPFGSVATGGYLERSFIILNTGTAPLTLSGSPKVAVSGSADFTVTTQPTSPITGPSGTSTFTVRFTPTGSGLKTASLSIPNNDGDEHPFVIQLIGTATTASALFTAVITSGTGLTGNDALPTATPFNDGVENLLKYAFNMNLAGPDSATMGEGGTAGLPTISQAGASASGVLCFEFVRRKGSGLVYTPKKSTTLGPAGWITVSDAPTVTPIGTDGLWERVIYEEPSNPSVAPTCFGIIEVTLP